MKTLSTYFIVEFLSPCGVSYRNMSGFYAKNIEEAHKNRCGKKNIERDHAEGIKDGSVRLIEKQGFFL